MIPPLDSRRGPDLGGQLRVTAPGSVVVSTDALLASADRLRSLERGLHEDCRRVVAADAIHPGWPVSALISPLDALRARCEQARDAFDRVAADYTAHEAALAGAQRDLAALIAATIGSFAVTLLARLVLLNPGLLVAVGLYGWSSIPDTGDGRLDTVKQFFLDHPELITSPEFTRFVSLLSTSIDDAVLGAVGVPPILAPLPGVELGPDGGVAAGALTLIGVGGLFGMFRETPVTVERESTKPVTAPPSGARGHLDRIPEASQVRIEKYEADGMPDRYVVYVAPTETFSPFAESEPRDLTSNIHGVAGLEAGAFRAVEQAMREAGIRPDDEVVVSGFSQGGLVATMVAGSGHWNVVGAATFGAPAGNIPLPPDLVGMAVRNTDDFIPALAGPQLDHSLLQVEREAFRDGVEIPDEQPAPAHQRSAYTRTADAIDAAESAVVREQLRLLDDFTSGYLDQPGGRATETVYRSVRTG
ncbi:hypothetical protein [Pseudolysinimonas sp.]|uniref:hypothetical protein n=1 Tax=Pseudolysinimonas sp. TaxID=2680009 RepID=UPI003784C96A